MKFGCFQGGLLKSVYRREKSGCSGPFRWEADPDPAPGSIFLFGNTKVGTSPTRETLTQRMY